MNVVGLFAWLLAATETTPAAATATGSARPAVTVVAQVRSDARTNPACLRAAVSGFLAGRGITVTWTAPGEGAVPAAMHAPGTKGRVLAIDVDLREPARAALTFAEGAGPPALREVTLAHGLDGVGCEAVADVIETAVLTMAEEPPAAPPAPPSPPVAPSPPAAAATARRTPPADAAFRDDKTTLALGYSITPVAWGVFQSGAELAFGMRPQSNRRRYWVHAGYDFPVTVDVGAAGVRWQRLSLALGSSATTRGRHTWFELGGHFGGTVAFIERLGTAAPLGGGAGKVEKDASMLLAVDFTLGVRVQQRAALYATLRFTVVSNLVTLDVDGDRLFESWALYAPALLIGGRWM